MPNVHVAYDTRSGHILSLSHGALDVPHAIRAAEVHSKLAAEHIAVKEMASEAFDNGKLYKIDLDRMVLVEAGADEGVCFGIGRTGRFS